ncbi:MAG: type II secretion system F family protein [Thermoprotei archaeon]
MKNITLKTLTKYTKKKYITIWSISTIIGTSIILYTLLFTRLDLINGIPTNKWAYLTIGLGILITITPPSIINLIRQRRINLIDREIPLVLSELSDGTRAGLTLIEAIERSAKLSKTPLRNTLTQTLTKIKLGLNIEDALNITAKKLESKFSTHFIEILKQTLKSGGNITETLSTSAKLYKELLLFNEEKHTELRPYTFIIYLSFTIYLIIAYITVNQFILTLTKTPTTGFIALINPNFYYAIFFYTSLMQAIFGGLVIGKITEGTTKAGLIHTTIMTTILLTTYPIITG